LLGRGDEVREHCYAISVERRVEYPIVSVLLKTAHESLFADEQS